MAGLVRDAEAGTNKWTTTGPKTRNVVSVRSLVIDPSAPGTLYAGTDVGVLKSINSGESWTNTDTAGSVFGTAGSVFILAIDPSAPATLYAGTGTRGVFKSINGGGSWTAINAGLGNQTV